MPPDWMWHLDEELLTHFEWVQRERKRESGREDDDEDEGEPAPHLASDGYEGMQRNEYASGRGRDS